MKNDKGITLIILAIMIIIITILSTVGITTGRDVINQSKYNRAIAKMKIMQTKVNEIYEEYKNGDIVTLTNYGISTDDISPSLSPKAQKAYISVYTENNKIGYYSDFRLYSADYIKNTLDIDGVEDDFLVNIETREVILINGTESDGKMYYSLSQIPNEQFNVEYEE